MGLGPPWAQRACHTCLGLQDLLGSTSLAWVRKSSCPQVLRGPTSLAWVYKSSVGLQVQRGSTSLAWVSKSSPGLQV